MRLACATGSFRQTRLINEMIIRSCCAARPVRLFGPFGAIRGNSESVPGWSSCCCCRAELGRHWACLGLPLRPSQQDFDSYVAAIGCRSNPSTVPRALTLGVTVEICQLPWPSGTHLPALHRTEAMIHGVRRRGARRSRGHGNRPYLRRCPGEAD